MFFYVNRYVRIWFYVIDNVWVYFFLKKMFLSIIVQECVFCNRMCQSSYAEEGDISESVKTLDVFLIYFIFFIFIPTCLCLHSTLKCHMTFWRSPVTKLVLKPYWEFTSGKNGNKTFSSKILENWGNTLLIETIISRVTRWSLCDHFCEEY